MNIVIVSNEELKNELLEQGLAANASVTYVSEPQELLKYHEADIFIDLLFVNTSERIELLNHLYPRPVVVNELISPPAGLPELVRINGWPTFLKRAIVEASGSDAMRERINALFNCFNKKVEWTPAIPGFISARVVAMIINEAYFALQEEVSSREEIDTAMKLGTNYPYGPFEWSRKIGLKNVYELLSMLAKTNKRYEPAGLLRKEVNL